MTNKQRSKFLDLIKNGDIQKAINDFLSIDNLSKSVKEEALNISTRYHQLIEDQKLSLVTLEEFHLKKKEIADNLIQLINHPHDQPFTGLKSSKQIPSKKTFKKVIEQYWKRIVGLVAFLASFVAILSYFDIAPSFRSPKQELTIYVRDGDNAPVLEREGQIIITPQKGQQPYIRTIEQGGIVDFSEIPSDLLGDSIAIGLKADYWIIKGQTVFKFNGDAITIKVGKDAIWGTIIGQVVERGTLKPIKDATVSVVPYTTTATQTDSMGNFSIILPEEYWIKQEGERYTVKVQKDGYQSKDQFCEPRSSALTFQLTQN